MESRNCLNCNEPLKGRIDKKFCDDQCRTTYNNRLNSDSMTVVRNINHQLKKNRRILEAILATAIEGKGRISGRKLTEKGFHFTYHTHQYKTKAGSVYYFCYEYGYLPLEHDYYMVVKRQHD